MKKIPWICYVLLAVVLVVTAIGFSVTFNKSNKYVFKIQRENMELMYEGARADLVQCIDSTIRVYAPVTCMNGIEILRQCEEYGIDIFFVLSQAHLESHFGTKGMAAKTNSVFNVYAYDGHDFNKINKNGKYTHPDLSITPYLKLLKNRYLVDGKTEMDLMNNYVDVNGNRYASSPEYEVNLTNMYHRYITNETLVKRFQLYTKYKILTGK